MALEAEGFVPLSLHERQKHLVLFLENTSQIRLKKGLHRRQRRYELRQD
jgi:hypothetical protein